MMNEGLGDLGSPQILGIGAAAAGNHDVAGASMSAAPSLTSGAQKWAGEVLAGEIPDATTYESRRPWLDEGIHPVDRFELMWDAAGRCKVSIPEHEIASVRAARGRWEAARGVSFGLDPFLAAQASRGPGAASDPA